MGTMEAQKFILKNKVTEKQRGTLELVALQTREVVTITASEKKREDLLGDLQTVASAEAVGGGPIRII